MTTKLYLAGPLFNPSERDYCVQLRSILSAKFKVYVPHIDGSLLPNLIDSGLSIGTAQRKIFASDIAAIRACDTLLVILNGRTVDEGAAFELGVAWALDKACFGIKDDFRQLVASGDNPMIEGALQRIFRSVVELKDWVDSTEG
jgi:nucleoside 2-deoxyribosyltransferase